VEKPHKKLNAWKQSVELAVLLCRTTDAFPKSERFGLAGQIRRAGVSVPSNIAEGAARQTKKEFIQYLHMAQGSLSELDTQIEIAKQLGYLDDRTARDIDQRMNEIDKMISGLIRHLKSPHS